MSIFIDRNKLFIVKVVGIYIHDTNGNNIGFKIQKDGDVVIEASASGRDFETMSKIIEDASIINSVNHPSRILWSHQHGRYQ